MPDEEMKDVEIVAKEIEDNAHAREKDEEEKKARSLIADFDKVRGLGFMTKDEADELKTEIVESIRKEIKEQFGDIIALRTQLLKQKAQGKAQIGAEKPEGNAQLAQLYQGIIPFD